MKKLLKRLSKKVILPVAVLAAVVGISAGVKAWYPDRPTFTVQNPAPYVTFDSITNNPNYGDERTFFDAKDNANTSSGGYTDQTQVTNGETVLLRVYVHNDASSNLDDPNNTGPGVAHNTSVRVYLPTATAQSLVANAYIDASNANPGEVADSTNVYGAAPFSLSYVPGSAVAYNNAHPTGMPLSDSIVTTGAPIGYNQADGNVPGCFQYVNIVTIKVKVNMPTPGFSITKQVANPGDPWAKTATEQPGSTVSYLLTVKNTGNTTLDNLSVRDKLPAGETLVPGSTTIYNNNNPNGISAGTDAISSNGINIGSYAPGTTAYVKYKAVVPSNDALQCGVNDLKNTATVFQPGNNTTQSDTADVYVTGTNCTKPTPTAACTGLNLTVTGDRTISAVAGYSVANGAQFQLASFNFGDESQPFVTNQSANNQVTTTHQYASTGTYKVTVNMTFLENGQGVNVASPSCTQTVTFTTPTTITTSSTPPTRLVNTGPGEVAGLFSGVSAAGAFGYRKFLSRKIGR